MPSRSSEGESRRTEGFFEEGSRQQIRERGFYNDRLIDPQGLADQRRNNRRRARLAIRTMVATGVGWTGRVLLLMINGALILHGMVLGVQAGMFAVF